MTNSRSDDAADKASSALPALDGFDDAALLTLMGRIEAMLAARDEARKREAVQRIRALARQAGLGVSIARTANKRGRPRKSETAAS